MTLLYLNPCIKNACNKGAVLFVRSFDLREVADDITHLELSLLETTNNFFYSILMYFKPIFPHYPSVN